MSAAVPEVKIMALEGKSSLLKGGSVALLGVAELGTHSSIPEAFFIADAI